MDDVFFEDSSFDSGDSFVEQDSSASSGDSSASSDSSNSAPSVEDGVASPPEEDAAPPTEEGVAPPMEGDSVPPTEEGTVPPTEEDTAPPADEGAIGGDETAGSPSEGDAAASADGSVLPPDDQIVVSIPSSSSGFAGDILGGLFSSPAEQEELFLDDIQTFALSPITSSTGLKGILLDIIGPYDNVVTQYRYQQNQNTNYTYVNEVTPDYPWIASAALFIALILSLFGLLKRSFSSWLR